MRLPPTEQIVKAKDPRARGYMENWEPTRASRTMIEAIKAVLIEYQTELPVTGRQIYYRLIANGTITNKSKNASKSLSDLIAKARRAGVISFDDIRDDGVSRKNCLGYDSESELRAAVDYTIKSGAIKIREYQPISQYVLCEAAGMIPQIAKAAVSYGADVLSSGGFNSLTAKHDLAMEIVATGKPVLIWHLGDYDPSGVHVFQSLVEDMIAFIEADGGEVSFQRLAVTPDQIEAYDLPMQPTNDKDARAFDGRGIVQCEALPPDVLVRIVQDALASYFDQDADDRRKDHAEELKQKRLSDYGIAEAT